MDELEKWTANLDQSIRSLSLPSISSSFRADEVKKWQKEGGVLILTDALFRQKELNQIILKGKQPDVLVIDEAHTMLKHSKNQISKGLREIQTKRRILLTGTPMQNNTTEYFQLIEFVRPGAIPGAKCEKEFEAEYR